MKTQQQPELTLITKKQVLKIIGFGKTKLFEMVRKDQFPQPIRFNQTCIRWGYQMLNNGLKNKPQNELR